MGIMTFKFFSWYKLSSNKKNLTLLVYGIAALTLAISIAEDAAVKLLMIEVETQEKSLQGAVSKSSFLYKQSNKYNAEIEYKVVNPNATTLYFLPNSNPMYCNLLNSIVLLVGFVFRWMAYVVLRSIYHRIGKMPLWFWTILSLPLIFYLIGKMPGFFSGESLAGIDESYHYFFIVLFRAGTVGGNIFFGIPFFIAARSMTAFRVKDYLIISGI